MSDRSKDFNDDLVEQVERHVAKLSAWASEVDAWTSPAQSRLGAAASPLLASEMHAEAEALAQSLEYWRAHWRLCWGRPASSGALKDAPEDEAFVAGAARAAPWDPGDEKGLAPSALVSVAVHLTDGHEIALRSNAGHFIATIDGTWTTRAGLLTDLLEKLAEEAG